MTQTFGSSRKPLRLVPGIVLAALLVLVRIAAPLVAPDQGSMIAVLGAAIGGVLILGWWLLFSRAAWFERLGAVVIMIVAVVATRLVIHPSIRGGMMGMMMPMTLALPWLPVALVAAVALTRASSARGRLAAIAIAVLLACGGFTLLRTDGVRGGGTAQIHWRWTPTAEERLLAQARVEPVAPATSAAPVASPSPAPAAATAPSTTPATLTVPASTATVATSAAKPLEVSPSAAAASMPVRWPGFRGPARDSVVRGEQIDTDWAKSPPIQLWRRPIGPGWSSFAVAGDSLFTQEQRGDEEIVAAYSVATGQPVWMHKDAVRFYESNGGAGPRGTPTFSNGRVFTLGATGILNALDAATGAVIWSRNAVIDAGIKVPGWGISASPAIAGRTVVVAVSGALAGYDVATGAPRWSRKSGGGSYSSPHLVTIDGVTQVLLMTGSGVSSVQPSDGRLLWEHEWPGVPIVQPAQIAGGDFLVTTADAMGALGIRRISVTHDGSAWTAAERWTSKGLKPYFNDFVVHNGYAYGFDGSILSCISLDDGARKWKGGRYGNGQLVLLPDEDVLLILSEDGELALVSAKPDEFKELARFKAIEGKTWNHPALIGDLLLVRNGEEMAAFRLPLASR